MKRLFLTLLILAVAGCGKKIGESSATADKMSYVFKTGDTLATLEAHLPPDHFGKSDGVGAVILPPDMGGVSFIIDDDNYMLVYFDRKSQMLHSIYWHHDSPSRLKAERSRFEIRGFRIAGDDSFHLDVRFPTPEERRRREEVERQMNRERLDEAERGQSGAGDKTNQSPDGPKQ